MKPIPVSAINGNEKLNLMFDAYEITKYQLKITMYCNANCHRNNNVAGINPWLTLEHLSAEIIDSAFDPRAF